MAATAGPRWNMDSTAAQQYMTDPLFAPEPSDETGPNSHFRSTFAPLSTVNSTNSQSEEYIDSNRNSERRKQQYLQQQPTTPPRSRRVSNPPRPISASSSSPRSPQSNNPYTNGVAAQNTGSSSDTHHRRRSSTLSNPGSSHSPRSPYNNTQGLSRGASLRQRFPGDMSHRPLDMIKQDTKAATKSHHLRKRSIPPTDTIDKLDAAAPTGAQYHHEGPYDATLAARNLDSKTSPVAAVAASNRETLRATPREKVQDSLEKHVPLDGVASVPPGGKDRLGRNYEYDEMNMMTEAGGDYKKFPGDDLNIDQIKELEKKKKYDISNGQAREMGESSIEMKEQSPRSPHSRKSVEIREDQVAGDHKRHSSGSFSGLKKRLSLRKRKE